MKETQENYTIKIKQFEGPFDLLLFFIERDEIDIMDIPISKITDDFLQYIRVIEELNLDVASEFILVAATLMKIKTKMLIPRPEVDAEGNEIDPRQELAQKLLEYKQFKELLPEMERLENERKLITPRGNSNKELKTIATKALIDIELESLTLFKLMRAFEHVMHQMDVRNRRPKHVIYRYNFTIEEQKVYIQTKLDQKAKCTFADLFEDMQDRIHAIVTFLSLLELINTEEITLESGLGTNNFWVSRLAA
jgi:segregation and condensation protein A